jgi:hypothetical protein
MLNGSVYGGLRRSPLSLPPGSEVAAGWLVVRVGWALAGWVRVVLLAASARDEEELNTIPADGAPCWVLKVLSVSPAQGVPLRLPSYSTNH